MRSGLVLAGGRSTRFGEVDKSLAEVDGGPMIRRVADRLREVTDELVVNYRDEQRAAVADALDGVTYREAVDPVPDEGPVAGMRTGLRVASGNAVAVVACDMPRADPALFERLFAAVDSAAVPRADGRLHPLHAVYDRHAGRVACDRTLAAGSRRLYDVLARVDPVVVDADDVTRYRSPFTNVNSRADLAAVTGRIEN
ncbi:molybdenum cofactor guanylyltransferase [Halobacteria archaeon HArc-gm2]|nr:molybdenum cofactor guanylyltransferase [Halobacteria archaeon HArc-gm2]